MNPEVNETQPNNPQDGINLTNDELAAAMGYMTTLGDQQMQAQMQAEQPIENGSEKAQNAPEQEETQETEETPLIDQEALKNEIKDELVKDVKNDMKAIIREELKKLLDEDDENETTKDSE